MLRARAIVASALVALLAACGPQPGSPDLPPLPRLETLLLQENASERGRAWDGVVEAVRRSDLSAQTTGRVTLVAADINDRVEAGAVLVRLTAVEQQAGADTARAEVRAAEAAVVEAEANHARYSALAAKQYVSALQLDESRAARDAAVAARDAARARQAQAGQQTDYTVVRAPFAGIVAARHVEPGESVAPGQPLLSMYAPDAMRIVVQVPQTDAAAIRTAGRATVILSDGRRVEPAAIVVFPAADPASHSVSVRVTLPTLEQPPQPGVTAQVVFPIGAGAGALRIPVRAVAQRGEVSGVYVLAGKRLSLRQLRLGQRVGDQVEVLAGLKAGETIAVDPLAAVQALAAQRKAAAGGQQ